MTNTLGLILCFTYIFAMIGLAEGLRRWRGYGSSFTRKVIHIGVGMMSWFIPFLFTSPWPFVAAAIPATCVPCPAIQSVSNNHGTSSKLSVDVEVGMLPGRGGPFVAAP